MADAVTSPSIAPDAVAGPPRPAAVEAQRDPRSWPWYVAGTIVLLATLLLGVMIGPAGPASWRVPLELLDSRSFADGVMRLHYKVQRVAPVPQLIA